LKKICRILFLLAAAIPVYSQQFYIRGDVKDESGNLLQNVNILLHSTGYIYHSGTEGSFGILTSRQKDSLSFSMDGYQKLTVALNTDNFISVKLKMLPANASALRRDKLVSLTNNLTRESQREWFTGDETYASIVENRFVEGR